MSADSNGGLVEATLEYVQYKKRKCAHVDFYHPTLKHLVAVCKLARESVASKVGTHDRLAIGERGSEDGYLVPIIFQICIVGILIWTFSTV